MAIKVSGLSDYTGMPIPNCLRIGDVIQHTDGTIAQLARVYIGDRYHFVLINSKDGTERDSCPAHPDTTFCENLPLDLAWRLLGDLDHWELISHGYDVVSET